MNQAKELINNPSKAKEPEKIKEENKKKFFDKMNFKLSASVGIHGIPTVDAEVEFADVQIQVFNPFKRLVFNHGSIMETKRPLSIMGEGSIKQEKEKKSKKEFKNQE